MEDGRQADDKDAWIFAQETIYSLRSRGATRLVNRGVTTTGNLTRQGLSRKEVADKLGVLIATYADWETGQSTAMAFPVLARLIRHIGGSLDDLQRIALAPEGHEALGL